MSVDLQITLVLTIGMFVAWIVAKALEGRNIIASIKDFVKEL